MHARLLGKGGDGSPRFCKGSIRGVRALHEALHFHSMHLWGMLA